jgi:replication factor C subunit 3/5
LILLNLSFFFLVIVIVEVDKLTRDAQHGLRRTMEKYVSSCRLILCCNSTSRVIPAIRSRCLAIRVAAPTIDEVCLEKEKFLFFIFEYLK